MHRAQPTLMARIGFPLIIVALSLVAGIGALHAPHTTGDGVGQWPTWGDGMAACQEEDGSTPGQPFPCRWERGSNGLGSEYTLSMPVCSLDQVAVTDARHAQSLPPVPSTCDDAESLGIPAS